jgi:D-proline reductase (dithiol) PrdB
MARIAELPLKYRLLLETYRYRTLEPVPFVRPRNPLSKLKVALVTTAGFSAPGQPPFDESTRGGDTSWRALSADVDLLALAFHQRSATFDHAGVERDRNLAFPLDRLKELAAREVVGSVAPRHLSFMGSITAPGRLVRFSAPEAAEVLVADGVEAALLVPL